MANEIDILLGGGMTPQNTDTDMMAAALRGQLNEGGALGMSTIRGVSDFGRQQSKAARSGAREAGRLKQALEKEARDIEKTKKTEARAFKQWEKKQKQLNERKDNELGVTEGFKIAGEQRDLQDKMDFEQFKHDLTSKGSNKLKPTGRAVQDYTKSLMLSNQIADVNSDFSKLGKEQVDMLDNPVADVLTEMFVPAAAERYVQDKYLYDDPKVKNYRAKVADIESEFSRLMSGLAVTGYELQDRQKWSPYASGIAQDTRNARLKNLAKKLSGQQDIAEETYNLGNIAGQRGTVSEQPTVDVIAEPVYTETRNIDGVNYGRDEAGNWHKVN